MEEEEETAFLYLSLSFSLSSSIRKFYQSSQEVARSWTFLSNDSQLPRLVVVVVVVRYSAIYKYINPTGHAY